MEEHTSQCCYLLRVLRSTVFGSIDPVLWLLTKAVVDAKTSNRFESILRDGERIGALKDCNDVMRRSWWA